MARTLLDISASPISSQGVEESNAEEVACGGVEHSHCSFHTPISALRGIAIATILVAGALGIGSAAFLRRLGVARDSNLFLIFKAFGAGVIVTTGVAAQPC